MSASETKGVMPAGSVGSDAGGHAGGATDRYVQAQRERGASTEVILASKARKKIVVAGPGTGKTFLFRRLLEGKNRTLTLTFTNALVEDLSLGLRKSSKTPEIRTLHGFALSILPGLSGGEVKVFPRLLVVIREDAQILTGADINFDQLFRTLSIKVPTLGLYEKRRGYYAHYGYTDIVFKTLEYLKGDETKIPSYEQILVDEFQDFNELEVTFIELLAKKNSVLLAGDDDQALYTFKDASPKYIRERYRDKKYGYEPGTLPFCSRCTRVIVEATNDVINAAIAAGLLIERIDKPYRYFEDIDKEVINGSYPAIAHAECYEKQLAWFISQQLAEIADEEKKLFSVIVITPTRDKARSLAETLIKKGFDNVEYVDRKEGETPSLLDGLILLLEDNKSNLGWRIVAKHLLKPDDFRVLVARTNEELPKPVLELIDPKCRRKVSKLLTVLRAIRDERTVTEEDMKEVLEAVGRNPLTVAGDVVRNEIASSIRGSGESGIRKLGIRVTTIQGSKGLEGDAVFITHFDDQFYIKDKKGRISEQDVYNFVVVLTRAKKKVILLSTKGRTKPTFLKWIKGPRIVAL